jgi:hypothetical protein
MKRALGVVAVLGFCAVIFAGQAAAQKLANVAGNWTTTTKMPDRNTNEQWTIQQNGDKLTGTVKGDHGEMPFVGTIDEVGFFRVDVKVADMVYKVRATVDGNSMDGSILIGKGEYLWSAKKSK